MSRPILPRWVVDRCRDSSSRRGSFRCGRLAAPLGWTVAQTQAEFKGTIIDDAIVHDPGIRTILTRVEEDDAELKELLGIPADVFISCTLTLGKPQGNHGTVRRRPMAERVYGDTWGEAPDWAVDPPGTRHTKAGPPKKPR